MKTKKRKKTRMPPKTLSVSRTKSMSLTRIDGHLSSVDATPQEQRLLKEAQELPLLTIIEPAQSFHADMRHSGA